MSKGLYRELTLNLPVRVTIHSEELTPRDMHEVERELQGRVERYLQEYDDGRHNFPAELIYDGTGRMVHALIRNIIGEYIADHEPQHKGMVDLGDGCKASAWSIEEERRTRNLYVRACEVWTDYWSKRKRFRW